MKMLFITLFFLGVLSGCTTIRETPKKQNLTSSEFLTNTCIENDFESCTALGLLAAAKNDFNNAKSYLMKACDGKNATACKELAHLKEKTSHNSLSAKPDLIRACKLGSQDSCNYLRIINFNDKRINELYLQYEINCSEKDQYACMSLGYGMVDARNIGEAKKYFEKACLLKSQQGCASQANYEFLTYQFEKAVALFKDLCKEKFRNSCHDLKISQMRDGP